LLGPNSSQGPQRKIATSIVFADLLILVNCVENRKKIQKNAKPILMDSWWKMLQLLLFSNGLILDIFNMKNRIVKYLDTITQKL
jgi:hypothetical protein